jgi:hypothetical protein
MTTLRCILFGTLGASIVICPFPLFTLFVWIYGLAAGSIFVGLLAQPLNFLLRRIRRSGLPGPLVLYSLALGPVFGLLCVGLTRGCLAGEWDFHSEFWLRTGIGGGIGMGLGSGRGVYLEE